jgi:hypothetical protein
VAEKEKDDRRRWLALIGWFRLSPEERGFIGGILLIALIGLVARHLHLRSQRADRYQPAGLENTTQGARR